MHSIQFNSICFVMSKYIQVLMYFIVLSSQNPSEDFLKT